MLAKQFFLLSFCVWIRSFTTLVTNQLRSRTRIATIRRSKSIADEDVVVILPPVDGYIRELGGYERLLARKTPGTNSVSLSHGAAFVFQSTISDDLLEEAVVYSMNKHPMLRAYIHQDSDTATSAWVMNDRSTSILAKAAIQTVKVEAASFVTAWQSAMQSALNNPSFPAEGPMWKLTNVVSDDGSSSAWIWCMNHGIVCDFSPLVQTQSSVEYTLSSIHIITLPL